jgi:hypothetical protein
MPEEPSEPIRTVDLLDRVATLESQVHALADLQLRMVEREESAILMRDDALIKIERIEELVRQLRTVFRQSE